MTAWEELVAWIGRYWPEIIGVAMGWMIFKAWKDVRTIAKDVRTIRDIYLRKGAGR